MLDETKKSKRFGFVTFSTPASVTSVLDSGDFFMCGKHIVVGPAVKRMVREQNTFYSSYIYLVNFALEQYSFFCAKSNLKWNIIIEKEKKMNLAEFNFAVNTPKPRHLIPRKFLPSRISLKSSKVYLFDFLPVDIVMQFQNDLARSHTTACQIATTKRIG